MKRAIVLFPDLAEMTDIESIRRSYDPLAGKIRPHVTLVFPFESELSSDEIRAHVAAVTQSTRPFVLTLGKPESTDDNYVWFPVAEGRTQVLGIHNSLHKGLLREFKSTTNAFNPHVTVAHVHESKVPEALRAARKLKTAGRAQVDRVVIESISQDDCSDIEDTVILTED